MAFRLKKHESAARGIKRVVARQIGGTAGAARRGVIQPDDAVHDIRTHCKRIRAALRLMQDSLGRKAYRRENCSFRDAARPLRQLRDAEVRIKTLDKVSAGFKNAEVLDAVQELRRLLEEDYAYVAKRVLHQGHALDEVAQEMKDASRRMDAWPKGKAAKALEQGLKDTYRKACKAYKAVRHVRTTENLHEWRKQAKYLWLELKLLQSVAHTGKTTHRLHELTEILGEDHDLFMLLHALQSDRFSGRDIPADLFHAIIRRRSALGKAALALGEKLFGEKPKAFAARVKLAA